MEAGPQAVTLKAVAARMGRTHANLLHHFGSAAGLQMALAGHLAGTVCDSIAEILLENADEPHEPDRVVNMVFDAFDLILVQSKTAPAFLPRRLLMRTLIRTRN